MIRRQFLLTFLFAFFASFGALTIVSSLRVKADISTEGAACVANAQGQVTGYSYFVPNEITIGANETKSITLRTFVCNGTPYDVEDDKTIFGNSTVLQTGKSGPIDFSVSLQNFFGDPNTWVQNMGGVKKGQFIYKDIAVNVDGSAFGDDGTYTIGVQGFGVVKYVSPQNGFNVGCGPSFGQCVTNVATTYLTLKIKRPQKSFTFSAKPVVQLPSLSPDNESPNAATFTSGVTVSIGSGGSSVVKGGKVTRQYEIRKKSGAVVALASPGAENRDLKTFTYPGTTVNGLSLQTGDKVCQVVTVSPSEGTVDSTGAVLTGSTTSSKDEKCVQVVNKPYVRFYGNDVLAGGAFTGGNCTNASRILTYYNDPVRKGSGVQLAAVALGSIDQFASAAQSASQPTGLTFANTVGGYGGQLGGSRCIADYWARRPDSVASANSVNIPALASGNYTYKPSSGIFEINAATISNKVGLYIDGDVVIKGDVLYAPGPWGSIADMPALGLFVRGNIFISSNAKNIEGVIVAQPKDPNISNFANGGRLYTCTKSDGLRYAAGELAANCSSRLVVTGAVIAQQVKLLRTIDSLRDGAASEKATTSRGAEVFQFSPEAYIAPPTDKNLNQSGTGTKYDYYTALPPIL